MNKERKQYVFYLRRPSECSTTTKAKALIKEYLDPYNIPYEIKYWGVNTSYKDVMLLLKGSWHGFDDIFKIYNDHATRLQGDYLRNFFRQYSQDNPATVLEFAKFLAKYPVFIRKSLMYNSAIKETVCNGLTSPELYKQLQRPAKRREFEIKSKIVALQTLVESESIDHE